MTSLNKAIDAVLAFVAENPRIDQTGIVNKHEDREHWRDRREELLHRCRAVKGEARKAELLGLQPGEGRFLSADVKFVGWCNVPFVWVHPPNRPATMAFGPEAALDEWREEMLALRAAETAKPPKKKKGRKPNPKRDQKIADDLDAGLKARPRPRWKSNAEYARHIGMTPAGLSLLLKRVAKREAAEEAEKKPRAR
jgi:hypothetical protein